jgi:hypothetical protein
MHTEHVGMSTLDRENQINPVTKFRAERVGKRIFDTPYRSA